MSLTEVRAPTDGRALIAVDLGAESCRVSLLRWLDGRPDIRLVHRFSNGPEGRPDGLHWPLLAIEQGVNRGLRQCAALAPEGVRALAVDGWAVDYVRLDAEGRALADPFCYRDERTIKAEHALHQRLSPEQMREITGIQLMRINTLYQLVADRMMELPEGELWLNLPEYLLTRWGASPCSEYTNATHTQMVDLFERDWSEEIFRRSGLDRRRAPPMVRPGTMLGRLRGPLAELPAFQATELIAPACHDTSSAIAGIPAAGQDWGYISLGTWSLVGTPLHHPHNGPAARAQQFTNLGGVGGAICFHKNINGMWLLKQCMDEWAAAGAPWEISALVAAAELTSPPGPAELLEVDDPDLLLLGHMPERLNAQRTLRGLPPVDETSAGAPRLASLIFHSLATRYAEVLQQIQAHTGKRLRRIFVVGGGSRNAMLLRLTSEATGLQVERGSAESATLGNFAVQLATLESSALERKQGASAEDVACWARVLQAS